ncbi:MAG TPA: hypothetical protein PLP24_01435 [Acetivibrio thermocellus]|uniref:hypothetical protein n=1 Tax=Acetivibrio thermocellus TaxID=1515 RepID=UPI0002FB1ED4|nr:hypothetical protein [Acetivibrio thermocellus]HOP92018.1 hypothetical protein [Acetivibrio thermocellus]
MYIKLLVIPHAGQLYPVAALKIQGSPILKKYPPSLKAVAFPFVTIRNDKTTGKKQSNKIDKCKIKSSFEKFLKYLFAPV